jgi:co-chaperonin GroES (HSP10)
MIRPTNNRILVEITPQEYSDFTTNPKRNLFMGSVYSASEGAFSENPVATDGEGRFSWARKPSDSNLKKGDKVLFTRDGLCVPATFSGNLPVEDGSESNENSIHLVLIEEANIFGILEQETAE